MVGYKEIWNLQKLPSYNDQPLTCRVGSNIQSLRWKKQVYTENLTFVKQHNQICSNPHIYICSAGIELDHTQPAWKSQNYRTAEVGRDLWRSCSPYPLPIQENFINHSSCLFSPNSAWRNFLAQIKFRDLRKWWSLPIGLSKPSHRQRVLLKVMEEFDWEKYMSQRYTES